METRAYDIIEMLYTMIAEARGVPLGNDKCILERDKALYLLDDLKKNLPLELQEAQRLVNARNDFVTSTKREAESIRSEAEAEAQRLLEKESVYQAASVRAQEIIRTAEAKSDGLRRAASQFLDDALRQTEDNIASALDNVRQARAQFRSVAAPMPEGRVDVTMDDVAEDIGELDFNR